MWRSSPVAGCWPLAQVLVALCMVLLACRPQKGPARSAFSRVDSLHFTVYADLPVAEIEEHTRRLESLLAAFLAHGWQTQGTTTLKVNVVMLADSRQLRALTGDEVAGYLVPSLLFEPWIVVPAAESDDELEIVAHELCHFLAFQAMPHQPRWFSEGLAGYFQTAKLDGDQFVLGDVPISLARSLANEGMLEQELLFDDRTEYLNGQFYGTAWLLVHYLMTEHGAELVKYQVELARGKSHAQAWAAAFPSLPSIALAQQLKHYLNRGSYDYFRFTWSSSEVPTTSRPLLAADEEVLWVMLKVSAVVADTGQTQQRLNRALQLDPSQPQALAIRAGTERDPARALALARQLTSRYPSLPLSWLTMASVIEQHELDDSGQPGAVDRALSMAPRQHFAWLFKASQLARTGDRDGALLRIRGALALQPSNPQLLWACAELLAQLEACEQLLDVARTIRQVGHTRLTTKRLVALQKLSVQCNQNAQK